MIVVAVLAILLVVLKTAVLESVRVAGVLPDPLLILTVYASRFFEPRRALIAGALVGSLAGLASAASWSLYPALYASAGWVAAHAWRQSLRASVAVEFVFFLPLALCVNAAILVADFGLGWRFARALVVMAVPNAIATAVAGPLLFAALKKHLKPILGGPSPRVARRW
ncbi:MAG: hypothetical protein ACKVU1_08240 [bacterium]